MAVEVDALKTWVEKGMDITLIGKSGETYQVVGFSQNGKNLIVHCEYPVTAFGTRMQLPLDRLHEFTMEGNA